MESFALESPSPCGSLQVTAHFDEADGNILLLPAVIQYLVYVLFYERFIENRVLNFIDLCSVSNISVFILAENKYGYYIHGRSPHGTTDVNMKEMVINLERESRQMSGTRGLEPQSTEQTFIIRVDGAFRGQYDSILQTYQVRAERRRDRAARDASSRLVRRRDRD